MKENAINMYAKGLISSSEAQNALGLASKEEFFSAVVATGRSIYHIDRKAADSMAETALRLSGLKE